MKKYALALTLILAVLLTACGGQPASQSESSRPPVSSSVPAQSSQPPSAPASGSPYYAGTELLGARDLVWVLGRFGALTGEQVLGSENVCYSPASLYLALSLVATGARGDTQAQLYDVMGVPAGQEDVLQREVAKALETLVFEKQEGLPSGHEDTSALLTANSVWLNDGYTYNEDFAAGAGDYWDADLFLAPFGTSMVSDEMNAWVRERTNGLIDPAVDTAPDDLMVLFNTLYLADDWVNKFEEEDNIIDSFTLESGITQQATYMAQSFTYHSYHDGGDYLQYNMHLGKGGRMSFILPAEGAPLSGFTTAQRLEEYLRNEVSTPADVNIRLPKFDFGSGISLNDALFNLGVEDAFNQDKSDFSGLVSEDVPVGISEVKQLSQIGVDEKGVEVAAATIIAMGLGGPPEDPRPTIDFFLDRPFLFFIEYDGYPLFMGVVAQPTEA